MLPPLLLVLFVLVILASSNLLQNPGFESGTSGWTCHQCSGSISSDKHGGSHSYRVSGRHDISSGASQDVQISGGHYYYFKIWIKLLNTAGGKWHHELRTFIEIKDINGHHSYQMLGNTKYAFTDRWYLVGGDQYVPHNVTSVRFYVQIPEAGVNYLVDDASMDEVAHLSNFVDDANSRINKLRKADLHISLTGHTSPAGLQIEVQQTKSAFGWGSAVDAIKIVDSNYKHYQDFFYDLFEWAVLENALKWHVLEFTRGTSNYDTGLHAVNTLERKGIMMRGHNIFWGGMHAPHWLIYMSGSKLKPEIDKHIADMTSHFKGRFKHWDVNNENLHQHFYEDKLHDEYITHYMFNETHRLDPTAKLYLNDFYVVSAGSATMALVDQASWFKSSGVPVGGLGIQSHFGPDVDVSIVKRRLDEVAAAGMPIWITELDIAEPDEHKKAQKYEELLSLFFSHPAVHGVMFWGFWDGQHWLPEAALANGKNVTANAAGRKVQELLKRTWRTNESHSIKHGQTVHIRGFMGSYKLLVHHNGKVIHTHNFSLDHGVNTLKINLSGSGSNPHVANVLIG